MAGVLALLLASLAAAPAADVARALEKVYGAGEYQTELPAGAPVADSAAAHPDRLPAEMLLFDLGPLAEVLSILVWAGAVVGAVLALVYVAQRFFSGALGDAGFEEPGGGQAPALFDAPLQDAQALAREGRYAEAIHVLLLRTFEQLLRGRGVPVAPGWTSREVLERASYPGPAREALAGLVGAVETCTFAGRPASEEDYLICADRFRQLAATLGGSA
jgi:Domain of unknown function (DUF4129)